MDKPICPRVLLIGVLACSAFAQQPKSQGVLKVASAAEARSANGPAEVLAFEREMEAAVVRGDVAYVDRVSARDLSFTHGDGWTTGGKPLLVDDRESFLNSIDLIFILILFEFG